MFRGFNWPQWVWNCQNPFPHLLAWVFSRLILAMPSSAFSFGENGASVYVMCNIPEAVLRRWVGHVDPGTLNSYTHIASDESRRAMDQLVRSVQERRTRSSKTGSVFSTIPAHFKEDQ